MALFKHEYPILEYDTEQASSSHARQEEIVQATHEMRVCLLW